MNVLVTGGTGFIGSHVIESLLLSHHRVVLLKRSASSLWRIQKHLPRVSAYNTSFGMDIGKIMKRHSIEMVIHLAGHYVKHHQTATQLHSMNNSNINFPTKILDAAVANNVRYFINTGTFFEYKLKGSVNERSTIAPFNYYAATKVAFEEMLKYYSRTYGIRSLTLKLFSPYGEKDNEKVIPLIIRSVLHNEKVSLTKGDQRLCFTYVGDIADAYIKSIRFLCSTKGTVYESFNIGQKTSVSIKEVVALVERIAKTKDVAKFGSIKSQQDETVHIVCDNSKAKRYLNWIPKTDIKKGLRRTYKYYQSQMI